MKAAIIIVSLLILGAVTAQAQDEAEGTIYVPEKSGTDAKLFSYSTGEEKPLLKWFGETPPPECPPGGFWLKDKYSVLGCDGREYELVPLDYAKYPAGWLGLKPKPEPPDDGDKTTEPMPHKKEQTPIVND